MVACIHAVSLTVKSSFNLTGYHAKKNNIFTIQLLIIKPWLTRDGVDIDVNGDGKSFWHISCHIKPLEPTKKLMAWIKDWQMKVIKIPFSETWYKNYFFCNTPRTPEVRSRNYWVSAIKKQTKWLIELWTLKQEMETDNDHAIMRESFLLVQNTLFIEYTDEIPTHLYENMV